MTDERHGEELARTETEQAMLRATIAKSGEMIAQAERLIASSRNEGAAPANKPPTPTS